MFSQPGDREQSGRDSGHATERYLDKRLLGHADWVEQLARVIPAAVRGVVPAEPLDRRLGPARLPRRQRAAALRRHVPGVRAVQDAIAAPPARRGRGRVCRAPGARGGRGRRSRPRRPTRLPVLPVRAAVLRGTCPAPGPRARPAPPRCLLRRGLSPAHVPARLGGAHRVRGPRPGNVHQRLGRAARRRHRMLRRPRVGLSGGRRYHGRRVHAGQGNRADRAGRLRRV